MSAPRSNILKKPISDRISIFEKSQSNGTSSSNKTNYSPIIHSGKNISALKSQFTAAVAHDLEPPPKSPILLPKSIRSTDSNPSSEPSTPETTPQKNPLTETPSNSSTKSSGTTKSKTSPTGKTGSKASSQRQSSLKSSPPATSPTKTRNKSTTSHTSAKTSSSSLTRTTTARPTSPTKKPSSSVSPTAKKTVARTPIHAKTTDSHKTTPLKSVNNKRPTSPTKSPSPIGASNDHSKKLSLSRILSPEPKKDQEILAPVKESTLFKKDSSHSILERKESSKSVLDRKDSNKSVLDRKDSNKSVLDRKDSNKSVLDRKDSVKSVVDRKESTHSVLDRKESTHSVLDCKESTHSVLDQSTHSVLDHKESTHSVFDRTESTHSFLERKESTHSVLGRKESTQSIQEPTDFVLEYKESTQSIHEPNHSTVERQEDSTDSLTERNNQNDDRKESIVSIMGDKETITIERKESFESVLGGREDSVFQRKESVASIGEDNEEFSPLERKESIDSVLDYNSSEEIDRKQSINSLQDDNESVDKFDLEKNDESESLLQGIKDSSEEYHDLCNTEEVNAPTYNPSKAFPPPRCVTPPPPKEEDEPTPATLPTVKVTVEDIKLVKKDSSSRLPPTTVVSDPDDEDEDEEDSPEDINRLNLRNSSYSSNYKDDDKIGGYRRNSIEKHIDTRVINANYMKTDIGTNQALQNDNSQTISEALKLDLEFKDEKINALNKELEELHNGGAVEEEIASLKKHKAELDARLMDQEEELDDLAGQVQMLEQSQNQAGNVYSCPKKKEHRKELSSKEEELEDARAAAQKRVKALEQQLENEHEERMGFVREKHDLETKIMNLQELASRSTDEEYVIKLKKDLKKTKALLKDAQCMIDKSRNDSSNKIVLRQLKNQLEDAEFAKTAAVKCRQNTEMELTEVQQQLDDVMRSKNDLEDKMMRICREKSDAQTQLEDNEEELSDIMKKYKSALEEERHRLKETLSELNQKIDNLESDNISSVTHSRLELKIRELESKLELEQATRGRMETQIGRLKEAIEKYNHECDILRNKELNSQDMARKLQRQLRDSKEDYASLAQKEMETNAKKFEYEKQLELSESEVITVKNDLKIALKRIEHLQTAMQGDLSSETDSVSDGESDMSDDGVDVFLEHHRRAVSVQRERESMARELSAQRELRASMVREMSLKPLETMSEHPEETSPLPEKYIEDEEDTVARSPPAPQKSPSLQLHDEVHLEGGESQA
ncbi:MYO18 [Lepeophtheirus salmonis]|uniref:MYO18 n=1 Tax=Lepeophtheirus salmonis TaxID=72036 RepID=A0A7R8H3Z1_LEPSM|nr:MYO18 [Lepeophtheirus salmonis]CAF2852862.1 MYO18 [Lepeophtheirus salmonis]